MTNRRDFFKIAGVMGFTHILKKYDILPAKEIPLHSFFIAGFKYYKGKQILHTLKVNDELVLIPEPENKYDNEAISIYTRSKIKIGYIPMDSNVVAYNLFKNDIKVICRISDIDFDAPDWEKVFCTLFQVLKV